MQTRHKFTALLMVPMFAALSACGGSSGGSSGTPLGAGGTVGGGGGSSGGTFLPSANYVARCANPRSGTQDRQGTTTDENNWLRSWTNETYLWFDEVTDRNPALTPVATDYFDLLKTLRLTTS